MKLDQLQESSLSRIYLQSQKHDSGTITAMRSASDCNEGDKYSKSDNKKRNKVLKAQLLKAGLGVTAVKGTYIENFGSDDEKEVSEDVYLVVDIKDSGKLESVLKKLGAEWEQDSILFIPKGGASGTLIGTNHCANGYPGFGKKINFKNPVFGQSGMFMTKVNGRPFTLKEECDSVDVRPPEGWHGKYACSVIAESNWEEVEL